MSGKSLISENSAKQIIDTLVRHAGEYNQLAADLQKQKPKGEYRECGRLIGAVMVAI